MVICRTTLWEKTAGGGGRNRKFRIFTSSSSSRGCPFIRNEFRAASATTTTTHPPEVHPGAEPTLVATHDRRRRIRRLGSTRLSSEMVLSSMEKRSMDRRKQWPTRVLTATVAFFSVHWRTPFILLSTYKTHFFRSSKNRFELLKYYFFQTLRG